MALKDISYLEFWWLFYSAEQNQFHNFSTEYYEEYFLESSMILDQ